MTNVENICKYAFNGCEYSKEKETFETYCERNENDSCPAKVDLLNDPLNRIHCGEAYLSLLKNGLLF